MTILNSITKTEAFIIIISVFSLIVIGFNLEKAKQIMEYFLKLFAELVKMIMTFFSSFIDAVKSVAYYFTVIRMMLFPSANKQTNFLVLRLAILFLSIASYITTFENMKNVINPVVAVLVTFSLQAVMVAISVHIGARFEPFGDQLGLVRFMKKYKQIDKNRRNRFFQKVKLILVLSSCFMASILFSFFYISNQIEANVLFSKNNYYQISSEFTDFSAKAEDIIAMQKREAITELERAAISLEHMWLGINEELSKDDGANPNMKPIRAEWQGEKTEDGGTIRDSFEEELEQQLDLINQYILSIRYEQEDLELININRFISVAAKTESLYMQATATDKSKMFFTDIEIANIKDAYFQSHTIAEWESLWYTKYIGEPNNRLTFLSERNDETVGIEQQNDIQREGIFNGERLFSQINQDKRQEYQEASEALIMGVYRYINALPEEALDELSEEKNELNEELASMEKQIEAFSQTPFLRLNESSNKLNGPALLLALLIDGLILLTCLGIGKAGSLNMVEEQRLLIRMLLVVKDQKEDPKNMKLMASIVFCALIIIIPLLFIPCLEGWMLIVLAMLIFVTVYFLIAKLKVLNKWEWFQNEIYKEDADRRKEFFLLKQNHDDFIWILKNVKAKKIDIKNKEKILLCIESPRRAHIVIKMLVQKKLAMYEADAVYFTNQFVRLLSEFAMGLHDDIDEMVEELMRMMININQRIEEESMKNNKNS